jgi:hypothetical protein
MKNMISHQENANQNQKRYYFIPTIKFVIKKWTIASVSKGMEKWNTHMLLVQK